MPDTITTTYGDISPRTAAYASIPLLERGQHGMTVERFGQAKPIPKKHSKVITFRRYHSLNPAVAPLAEGVPPEGQKLTKTDITATLEQYGDMIEITDVIQDTHEDNVLQESMKICGEQIAETLETIRISVIKGGTNVFYANNVSARTSVGSVIARGDLRRIVRSMHKNKAKRISEIVSATAKIATEPVGEAFFAMCHTDLISDIRNLPGFVPGEYYSASEKRLPHEVGKCEDIRFVCTALFTPWDQAASSVSSTTFLSNGSIPSSAGAPDVYPIIIVAKDSYAIVPLQGENAVHPIVLNPNKPSKYDPLGQKGFVAWKTYQTACILNQLWIARLEVACTAKPS
jgi:N4-gp56 family major capsid protein